MKSETFRTLDKRRKIFVLAVIIGCMGIVGAVQAAGTDYQNVTTSGNAYWATATNWKVTGSDPVVYGIPGTDTADTLTISGLTGTYNLYVASSSDPTVRTIASLSIAGDVRFYASPSNGSKGNATLNVTNDFTITSGNLYFRTGGTDDDGSTLNMTAGNFTLTGGSIEFGQSGGSYSSQYHFGGLTVSGTTNINSSVRIARVSTAAASDVMNFGDLVLGSSGSIDLARSASNAAINTVRVNSLSSTSGGTIRVSSNEGDDTGILIIQGSSTAEYKGTLQNGGGNGVNNHNILHLTKTGTGTQILSGTNTYTGATTVENGTLLINSSLAAGSAVSVTGGTLGGSGTVNGAVTVDGDAVLLGGTGLVGTTLTLNGNLTLEEDSIIALTLGDGLTHSVLKRTGAGTWSFDENQRFTLSGNNLEVGTYSGVIIGLADDPDVTNWTITNEGITGVFSYNAGNIDLTLGTIPEPHGMALIGGLLLLGWGMYRRFRHRTSL